MTESHATLDEGIRQLCKLEDLGYGGIILQLRGGEACPSHFSITARHTVHPENLDHVVQLFKGSAGTAPNFATAVFSWICASSLGFISGLSGSHFTIRDEWEKNTS